MGCFGDQCLWKSERSKGKSWSVIQSKQKPQPSQGDPAAEDGTEELSSNGAKDPAIRALC